MYKLILILDYYKGNENLPKYLNRNHVILKVKLSNEVLFNSLIREAINSSSLSLDFNTDYKVNHFQVIIP